MARQIPSTPAGVSEDPFLLSKEDFDALGLLGDRITDLCSDESAEALRNFKRKFPPLVCLHEPTQPELRAGIVLQAIATARGRSIYHAYKLGRAAACDLIQERCLIPRTEQPASA